MASTRASSIMRHSIRLSAHSQSLMRTSVIRNLSSSSRTFAQVVTDAASTSQSRWESKTAKELVAELSVRGIAPRSGRLSRHKALQLLLEDEAAKRVAAAPAAQPPSAPAPAPALAPAAPAPASTSSPAATLSRPPQVQTRAASTTSTSSSSGDQKEGGKDARVRGARVVPSTGVSTPADIVLPEPWQGEEPEGIKIPILPSYGPTRHTAPAEPSTPSPTEEAVHVPRVSTASLASTYAGSGPSHAHFPDGIPSTLADHSASEGQSRSIGDMIAKIEAFDFALPKSLQGLGGRVKEGLVGALGGVEKGKEGEKKEEKKDTEEKFEYEDRKLNDEERWGLYALGATLVGGWALGGLLMPRRGSQTEKVNAEHQQ